MFEKVFGKSDSGNSEKDKSDPWSGQLSQAVADARSRGVGSKKTKSGDENAPGKKNSGSGVSGKNAEKLAQMFTPDTWRPIIKTPFALGKAMTGRECWDLEKAQEDTLATTTSASAEYLMIVDPKWAILGLCAFNWAVILSQKFLANGRERAKELALNPPLEPKTPGVHVVK